MVDMKTSVLDKKGLESRPVISIMCLDSASQLCSYARVKILE